MRSSEQTSLQAQAASQQSQVSSPRESQAVSPSSHESQPTQASPISARSKTGKTTKTAGKGKSKAAPDKDATFQWTDDEVRLLLEVTRDYKVKKEAKSVDWESVRSKYNDIHALLKEKFPEKSGGVNDGFLDIPHGKDELSVKNPDNSVEGNPPEIPSGSGSGYGRLVLIFYELCNEIWGGNPATEKIFPGGWKRLIYWTAQTRMVHPAIL